MAITDVELPNHVVPLTPHPDTPPRNVTGILCYFTVVSAGQWRVQFAVECTVGGIMLPAELPPRRADGLWQATCFELFVLDPRSGAYLEYNMSPSGCWAAYAFDGYREAMRELAVPAITVTTVDAARELAARRARLLELRAKALALGIPPAKVDEDLKIDEMLKVWNPDPGQRHPVRFSLTGILNDVNLSFASECRLGMSAVIEEQEGTKSYWALAHPPGKPDFHHPACFAITLPTPGQA